MTVFGNRIFKEVTKVKEVMRVGPKPVQLASFERRSGHRHTQRKDHVKAGRRWPYTSQGEGPQNETERATTLVLDF